MYILKRTLNVFQALIISLYFPKPLAVRIAEQKLGKSKKTEGCKRGNQGNTDLKLCCSFFGPAIKYSRFPPHYSHFSLHICIIRFLCDLIEPGFHAMFPTGFDKFWTLGNLQMVENKPRCMCLFLDHFRLREKFI